MGNKEDKQCQATHSKTAQPAINGFANSPISFGESDGSPHGSDLEYWERARELIGIEDSRGSAQLPLPQEDDPAVIIGQPVEEAAIQDNLGEFPDRLSDQGEHPSTPNVRNLKG